METPTVIADPEDNLPVEVVDLRPPRVPTFIWLDLNWSVTGRTVTRSAIHNGRSVSVVVTTETEQGRGGTYCLTSEPFIDDEYLSPQADFATYEAILQSAGDFVSCNQAALVSAHWEYCA